MNTTGKFKTGSVELPADEFADKNVKVRVTTMLDADVLRAAKAEADRTGTKYQTLINQKLREVLLGGARTLDTRVSEIEAMLAGLSGIEDLVKKPPKGRRSATASAPIEYKRTGKRA